MTDSYPGGAASVRDPRTEATLATGDTALRRAVFSVALAGLAAADPHAATRRVVSYDAAADVVTVDGRDYPLAPQGRVLVVGAGKASHPIAAALAEVVGTRVSGGVVVTRDPALPDIGPIRVMHSDHPLPSERSVAAAEAILACVDSAGPDDLVLACFTGGSSALASLPPNGVGVAEKRALHQLLLSSGLGIADINAVRKQVSRIKGGRVAVAAAPARVVNLTVSDVAGSPLDAVTDPTVQDTSTVERARELLHLAGLWDAVSESIRVHLSTDHNGVTVETVPQTVVLADGATTVAAMADAAAAAGFRAVVVTDEVEGDASAVADRLCRRALSEADADPAPMMLLGCGGEAVVTLSVPDSFGDGGPNQECALVAAQLLQNRHAAAVFLDTDGSDGGTEYAGALVDGTTAPTASRLGVDLDAVISSHHATEACEKLAAAVWLGHTGTNVNDMFAIAVTKEALR
jgi:hydroxypyruvate reductase/glycerate 2-kinase